MNIALGALILILLILPAISFRFGVNRSSGLKELIATISITDSFWAFLITPVIIQLLGIFIISLFTEIRFDIFYSLIVGNDLFPTTNNEFRWYILEFLGYTILTGGMGYLLGYLFAKIEEIEEDQKIWGSARFAAFLSKHISLSKILGLQNNQWYNLLDGESDIARELKIEIDMVYLDVLTSTKETTAIYSGFLWKYYFKQNSKELGYIVLKTAVRRDLRESVHTVKEMTSDGKMVNKQFHSEDMGKSIKILPGYFFVIPREEILNINVMYIDATMTGNTQASATS